MTARGARESGGWNMAKQDGWVNDGIAEERCQTTLGNTITIYHARVWGFTRGEFRKKEDAELFLAALKEAEKTAT